MFLIAVAPGQVSPLVREEKEKTREQKKKIEMISGSGRGGGGVIEGGARQVVVAAIALRCIDRSSPLSGSRSGRSEARACACAPHVSLSHPDHVLNLTRGLVRGKATCLAYYVTVTRVRWRYTDCNHTRTLTPSH